MWRRRGVVSSLIVLFLSSIPGWSQIRQPATTPVPRMFSIRGSLRSNEDNHPLEMIRVELRRTTGETVSITFTRSNGEFEFTGLSNGIYAIVVEERGYEPVRENVEVFNIGRSGVFIFLRRPLEVASRAQEHTVSVRELGIPRKARDAMQKGMERLYEKQDFKGSLAHFQRAVAEFPAYYEAYHQMGMAYLRLEQSAEAEQALRKSIELSENHYAQAHFLLANILSTSQRFAEAEVLARRGLELDGNAWQGHYELARALLGLNQADAAEKSAQVAHTRKPDFPPIHLVLANIHIRKHDYPAVLQDVEAYLALEPTGPMSDQARQTQEKVQRLLAHAPASPPAVPPKP